MPTPGSLQSAAEYHCVPAQVDNAERGFSFVQDGPLDMRMGPSAVSSAEDIINSWSEADLGRIFREYGEERAWRHIAHKIVEVRQSLPSEAMRWKGSEVRLTGVLLCVPTLQSNHWEFLWCTEEICPCTIYLLIV